MDSFLWGLKIADALTMELTAQMTTIALGVAVICFICNLSYNYLFHGVSQLLTPDENKFPDMMEIARCFALFFCLTLYTPIAKTIVGTLEVINENTSLSAEGMNDFASYTGTFLNDQHEKIANYEETALQAQVDDGEDTTGAAQKELDNKTQENETSDEPATLLQIYHFMNPGTWVALFLHAVAVLLVGIIQFVILGIGVVIVKILVILGPFVFAVSILPVFQKQLSAWFGTLCSAGMVFTVINILNQIMSFTLQTLLDAGAFDLVDEATSSIQTLCLDLAMIGAYCSSFWLAGKIVGHGDAGRIISKTVSIVTTAATMAIAGSAIAGGATNVGSAASLGKSIINDEEK